MEFFILQDTELTFPRPENPSEEDKFIERYSEVECEISAAQKKDGADTKLYTEKLSSSIIEDLDKFKTKGSTLDWKVKVAISLANPVYLADLADPSEPLPNATIRIHPERVDERNLLSILEEMFEENSCHDENISVNIFIKRLDLNEYTTANFQANDFKVKGLKLENGNVRGSLVQNFEREMLHSWLHDGEFKCRISVSVVLNSNALNILDKVNTHPKSALKHFKRMLEDAICWDTEIVVGSGSDQVGIKCHRSVLATESEVFRRMFESGMKEATGNRVEMEGVSEAGVRALLAYLYYRDTTALHQSSETARELLQAAEKYDIKSLKFTVHDILMSKEGGWFGLDRVLLLYIFIKAVSTTEEEVTDEEEDVQTHQESPDEENDDASSFWNALKLRALRVLKWYHRKKPKTVMDSVMYKDIYNDNPELARELCSGMTRLD